MGSSSEECGDLSSPLSLRPSRKGSRPARPPSPPSACEESVHYPIFNPEDPRHNPALESSLGLEDADSLPQAPFPAGSMRWMQGLPGRSLRRARSGLHALRSGLQRRPARSADGDHVSGELWSSSNSAEGSSSPNENLFSSTVSEASTEEDYEFGTNLYRTGCHHPYPKDEYREDITPPAYIAPYIPATSAKLSTVAELPLVFPVIVTDTSSDEGVSTVPTPADAPSTILNGSSASDDDFQHGVKESGVLDLPIPTTTRTANHLDVAASDMAESDVAEDNASVKTEMSDSSRRSSPSALPQSLIEQIPCGGTEITVTTKEIENHGAEPVENGTERAPEIELGDLGGNDYYLSLNALDNSEAHENNTSEDQSPNSPSEDGRYVLLSPWLPVDKSDRRSLLRDEYFVDGKPSDRRPDGGSNAVKAEPELTGDGRLYIDRGLDRNRSLRHEVPELIGPRGPIGFPGPQGVRRDRRSESSEEEYLVTYGLLHRHYFS
ncbi:uncharacterized protein DSM5745_02398 [Aspergillus mulundensis]|uniref:Uncharacterized protein n=1 Tax=Aspergillus mulundensis TaxID=1810919 RepID=A0A3D8SWE2_9EURO|nr:hypothetical protein DSM5745_02398 [Aspergillus mulundensis]RDW90623.1 hypothetical protein DSM5745_02398 [Aspergillus mulundensis]